MCIRDRGHHFGILKTKIAQIRTVKREREVAEGVNKRDSRKIKREERAARLATQLARTSSNARCSASPPRSCFP